MNSLLLISPAHAWGFKPLLSGDKFIPISKNYTQKTVYLTIVK